MQKPSHSLGADPAAPDHPQRDETPDWQEGGFWNQHNTHNCAECAADQAVDQADGDLVSDDDSGKAASTAGDQSKAFATLAARLALKGYSLSRTAASDGPVRFYVTRWGTVRELRDLAAVEGFIDLIGGVQQ